jgi:hypothetical protein
MKTGSTAAPHVVVVAAAKGKSTDESEEQVSGVVCTEASAASQCRRGSTGGRRSRSSRGREAVTNGQ